jgi:predicted PP-loop superfamily ATPase
MHTLTLVTVALLGFWGGEQVKGNGRVVERPVEVQRFERVGVSHGIDAVVEVGGGGAPQVVLEGEENLLELVEVVVEGDALQTRVKGKANLRPTKPLRLRVRVATLRGVAASGGSDARVSGVRAREFEVAASGGSDVEVSGSADAANVMASGGSDVDASDLAVRTLRVMASGGSDVDADVSDEVSGMVSGGSDLSVRGGPAKVSVSRSGGSEVHTGR